METNKQVDVIVKEIGDNINAIKTKGEAQDAQLKVLDAKITLNQSLLGDKYDGLRKDFDEVTTLLKKGRIFSGSDSGNTVKDMVIAQKEGLSNLKKKAGIPVSFQFKANQLFTKAAGNVTEGGNLLGTDPLPPTRLAGVYAQPLRKVHIRQFINTTATDSNQILYNLETGSNDGTATTAEGTSAAQSDFTITGTEVLVRKLNTYLTISKEMMEDADFVDNYINTRIVGRLLQTEDNQILYGNNTAPNLMGLKNQASYYYNYYSGPSAIPSINYFDILSGAVTQGRVGNYVPNYIFVHPADYNTMVTSRDSYGRYQFPNFLFGQPALVNEAQVIANTAVNQGDFFAGDFNLGATLAYRDEINVTFSNQHVDNFVKGFITVLVEERVALVVYRPTAFVYGTFNLAMASGS
ncbi:MAG: phage major capsid protein [Bacteroidia bacterium]|nr:phage major capsid protein [Bacteroidia bacterium]